MKNNKITFSQFLSVCFLSSLSSIMFIKNTPSVFTIVISVCVLLINLLVFLFYKGNLIKLLKPVCVFYLSLYCVYIIVKFSDYMNTALSYGPACLTIAVILFFIYFCTVKGSEAVARASTVISVFVIVGIIYMFVCVFTNIDFRLSLTLPDEYNSVLILFIPSVLYILYYDSIINVKIKYYAVYSVIVILIIVFFLLISSGIESAYPIQHLPAISKIGVFKGSDCILLAVLTISCVFSVTSSTVVLFRYSKHKYITNIIYISSLLIISVIISFFKLFSFMEKVVFAPVSLLVILFILIILSIPSKSMYKNS